MNLLSIHKNPFLTIVGVLCLILVVNNAFAEPITSDIYENVLDRFHNASRGWAAIILAHASRLFWTLVLISMVWTFGMMALRRADIGDFFAELVRFIIFTGLFWWFLLNGPSFGETIITSLRQIGGEATRLGPNLTPSSVVDIGFAVFFLTLDMFTVSSPVMSSVAILLGFGVLALLALVAVNMLILLVSGWVLLYGGVFFLGFGGARWTSDLAINYYKTVLGVAASLFAMVLIVGVATSIIDQYYRSMASDVPIKELVVVMMIAFIMAMLVKSIPPLISGIITGASINQAGSMGFGAGAIFGAAGMAVAAVATGGAAIAAGTSNAVGGTQALMAACRKGAESASESGDGLNNGMEFSFPNTRAYYRDDLDSAHFPAHAMGDSIMGAAHLNGGTSNPQPMTSAKVKMGHAGDNLATPIASSKESLLNNRVAASQTEDMEDKFERKNTFDNNFLAEGKATFDLMADEVRDFVNRSQSSS